MRRCGAFSMRCGADALHSVDLHGMHGYRWYRLLYGKPVLRYWWHASLLKGSLL